MILLNTAKINEVAETAEGLYEIVLQKDFQKVITISKKSDTYILKQYIRFNSFRAEWRNFGKCTRKPTEKEIEIYEKEVEAYKKN